MWAYLREVIDKGGIDVYTVKPKLTISQHAQQACYEGDKGHQGTKNDICHHSLSEAPHKMFIKVGQAGIWIMRTDTWPNTRALYTTSAEPKTQTGPISSKPGGGGGEASTASGSNDIAAAQHTVEIVNYVCLKAGFHTWSSKCTTSHSDAKMTTLRPQNTS